MGFLNHATNNIIIDAVLTERGREYLAQNNGSFRIASFAFGDDEVDYSLIQKYGLTIGKEKIIKNTPVFEANPNENIALKHQCISFPNPITRIDKMPVLSWYDKGSSTKLSFKDTSTNIADMQKTIEIRNSVDVSNIASGTTYTLDSNLKDREFLIKMNNNLLTIPGINFSDTDTNNIATYIVQTSDVVDTPAFVNEVTFSLTLSTNGIVTNSDFDKYAVIGNSNRIATKVQVIGKSSGASININVEIDKSV